MATVYQETGIRNLDYGDRDSVGLFQQRPSQGWGSARQLRDPYFATNAFYDALVKIDQRIEGIVAELAGSALKPAQGDDAALLAQVDSQFRARRQAHQDAVEAERATLQKARQDLSTAREIEAKLRKTVPIYKETADGWAQLAREGFAGKLLAQDEYAHQGDGADRLPYASRWVGDMRVRAVQSPRAETPASAPPAAAAPLVPSRSLGDRR